MFKVNSDEYTDAIIYILFRLLFKKIDKKISGKSKDEQMAEKKQELEKRLQDVTGQLGSAKKASKKGKRSCFIKQFHISIKSPCDTLTFLTFKFNNARVIFIVAKGICIGFA